MVRTDKQTKFVTKKLALWKKVTKGLLKTRVYEFVSDLEDEEIWLWPNPKETSAASVKKRNAEVENSKVEHQHKAKSFKVTKSTTPRLKADGTLWLPHAEWLKKKQEERDAKAKAKNDQIPQETSASLQRISDIFALQNFNKSVEEYPHLVFKWDGRSSIHVVKDKSLLSSYRPDMICHSIAAYNGKTLKGAGDMKIRLADGSVGILKDVFHNEESNANLLSTNSFTPFYHGIVDNKLIRFDTGDTIWYLCNGTPEVKVEILKFDSDVEPTLPEKPPMSPFYFSRSHQPRVQENAKGNELKGLDVESGDEEVTEISATPMIGDDQQQITPSTISLEWHAKLGHPGQNSFDQIKKALQLKDVSHVPVTHCDTCLFGKAKRSIPKVSSNSDPVTKPFQVLHADLCGPFYQPVGHDNSLYFLTIVDSYSRYVHAVPIRFKSEGGNELKKFILESITRFGSEAIPREVRSDNGTEFLNDNLENFLEQMGIRNGLTNSYSSYQNGMAERRNQMLQGKARCLLLHASAPLIFWPEAIRLAAVLINWCPSRVIGWKTPMEVWYGEERKQPDLHIFGCLVHAVIPSELQLSSWEGRSVSGAYLGPSVQRAGHRIVSFEEPAQVFDCSQVQFVESRLYFQEYDFNPVKLRYHNKSPSGLLPGIQRPKVLPKKGSKEAEFEALKVKEFFRTLTDVERVILEKKRAAAKISTNSSATKRTAGSSSELGFQFLERDV